MTEDLRINLVSAFGRGETLALALIDEGFDVQVLDFTEALGSEWHQGVGPFPVADQEFLPKQRALLDEVRGLARGLTFWLPDGPLETSGPMTEFYLKSQPALANLKGQTQGPEFEMDWLRRFMGIWASPYDRESWAKKMPSPFPWSGELGLVPAAKETRLMSFERFQALGHKYQACQTLRDIQFEGARLTKLEVEAGRPGAYPAPQWIWCLSSQETDRVGVEVAQNLFSRHIRKAQWRWLQFQGRCYRGPWSAGFPEYTVLIDDLHLSWAYTNMTVLRWTDVDVFQAWIRVPADAAMKADRRREWAQEIQAQLARRLPMAGWNLDAETFSLCPHSPVFDAEDSELSIPSWKNWDWIAPEVLPRLDLSARLEKEAATFQRLVQWRADQIKKQGARRDSALHAP